MSETPIIRIENLTWKYPNDTTPTLNNISLTLNTWDFCFIVGKSGVGKTTLAKFILRQLKPPKWTIFHHRDDIARYSSREIQRYRRKIWIIFQDCKLLDRKTVQENILYALAIDWENPKNHTKTIQQVIDTVWLHDKVSAYPKQLSGWEKQRVATARALIRDPEFLIADEPTGNIDEDAGKKIADKFIQINKQGKTILFITHDTKLIEYVERKHPCKTITIA